MNLISIFERHPEDHVALISRGKTTTYGQLTRQAAAIRGGLDSRGLKPGDRVAIVCGNNWYFVASYLAIVGGGMVAVPLNPLSPPLELEVQLDTVGTRAAIVGPTARDRFAAVDRSRVPSLNLVVGCGFLPEGGVELDELLDHDPLPCVECDDNDVAAMMFTSGTAGSPKAAMLTHGNLRTNIAQSLSIPDAGQRSDDVVFGVLPMFHIFGLNVMLGTALAVGASVLLVERFDPLSAIESIDKHGVTVVSGPPTMWSAWAGWPDVPDGSLSSVRIAISGAARLFEETADAVHDRFGIRLHEGYGLTEASPVVTSTVGTEAPVGSVGIPIPGLEVRIVDTSGDDVLVGDTGELWVRGGNVFAGYFDDQEATDRALDPHGWLHTGDVATVDDSGYLYLVDRVKDLIIVSGFNVYPAEVEEVLNTHPGISACAVLGVPHPHSGEAVKAYVVPTPGVSVEEDEVISFCTSRLARYKCPDKVLFVDEIPTGLGGKVLRRALR